MRLFGGDGEGVTVVRVRKKTGSLKKEVKNLLFRDDKRLPFVNDVADVQQGKSSSRSTTG